MTNLNILKQRAIARDQADYARNQQITTHIPNRQTATKTRRQALLAAADQQARMRTLAAQDARQHGERTRLQQHQRRTFDSALTQADRNLGDWRAQADANIYRTTTGQWATQGATK